MDYSNYLMKIKLPRIVDSFVGKKRRLHLGLGSSKGIEEIKDSIGCFLSNVTSDDTSFVHKALKLLKPIIPEHRDGLLVFHMGDKDSIDEDFVLVKPLAQMAPDYLLLSYEDSIDSELRQFMVHAVDNYALILVDAERIVTYRLQDASCNQVDDVNYHHGNRRAQKHLVSSLLVFDQLKSEYCRGLVLGFQRGCEWLEDCLPEGIRPVSKKMIHGINDTTWEELIMNADMNSLQISREICILGEFYEVLQTRQRCTALGLDDTLDAVNRRSVDTLILWEGMDLQRCVMVDQENEELIDFLPERQATPKRHPENDRELITVKRTNLADWFNALNEFSMVLVTDSSSYGQQFQGSGGIGALLKGFRSKGSHTTLL